MKTLKIYLLLLVAFIAISASMKAQDLNNLDKIAPFSDGLAAIQKGDLWGFMNEQGELEISFRSDIYISSEGYPQFNDGYCLISIEEDGIPYYGYINTKGKTIIETQYLAATSFENGLARVIKHYKTENGHTNALGKTIVSYSYNELVINKDNMVVQHLRGPQNLLFEKKALQKDPPVILSNFIAPKLLSFRAEDNSYTVIKINQ